MNSPTPYSIVRSHFTFPDNIHEREYQINTVNDLGPLPRAGYYLGGGTGKTFIATVVALFKRLMQGAQTTVIVMPPILIVDWAIWLSKVGPAQRILSYLGTPKERKALKLRGQDFILMSLPIFKLDHDHIMAQLEDQKLTLIVDEAHSIKNISSANYKVVRDTVMAGADLMPLTATPLSTPIDGYAFIKLVAPHVYKNLNQFENVHVAERDFFKKPTEWKNLDLLRENMKINSVRIQRREVSKDLPPVIYTPMHYELAPAHYKLYKQLAEEKLLEMPDGGKIDATQENALYHAMQQVVLNWDYFSQNPANVARGLELIEEVYEQCDGKLVVVANYRMTNRTLLTLLSKFNAVAAYGDIPTAQQAKNKTRFIDDKSCGIFLLQPSSAGYGLDGLQHVCSDMLIMELPQVPKDFHQTVWRLDRDGQKEPVNVRLAVAEGTIQIRKMKQMLAKDELVGRVQPNLRDLRSALFGG